MNLELQNTKPIVFHGDNGFHKKTGEDGAASYYYSITRLKGSGTLDIGDKQLNIKDAEAWMDHEVFTPKSTNEQFGWDWFAIQFNNGTELMIYQLRDKDRAILPTASGSFVKEDGSTIKVNHGEYKLTPLKWWVDPKTQTKYPISWQVEVPKLNIDIKTLATVNQQVVHPSSILQQTTYWEGKCTVTGSHTGKAYVELVGYK